MASRGVSNVNTGHRMKQLIILIVIILVSILISMSVS